jgi:DNA topoisomerase VI subunit B
MNDINKRKKKFTNKQTQHIIDNFPLFGFSNKFSGILQATKELIDNSIDAIRAVELIEDEDEEMKININIRSDPNNLQNLKLTISDTGLFIFVNLVVNF